MSKVKIHYKDSLGYYTLSNFLKDELNANTIIVCIGTDRCIGDCLGPLIGSMLEEKFFPLPVYGTIANPIHALNLDSKLSDIKLKHPDSKIIGIDACLGPPNKIGEIQVRDYPINPGKGVGKSLSPVGDISIIGIVDSSDIDEPFTSRNIRLNLILEISKVITQGLVHGYYLSSLCD
ncbi:MULTISPECIES: spore protease YyaC [Clostridium]|uniref:Spore protease YyaC n=1 Tax=Clostridium sulfidigenes TaxID=318464 RepID=A0A084J7T7_9CLOT|nr:spore protease YyaC [Clostridium sulfidigenes]HAR86676.1 spore protease YyaC [Clostridium sp.]KEZ85021.1 sporulation protein [Clostridium sulfidigenes]MBE6060828.1 spore protease YyaC [Clostridium sulfidigenes]HBA03580.1 spore protease YyaC [Clostridium sp.]HBL06419.1 spore protease YyaC [Clostridium sp.]